MFSLKFFLWWHEAHPRCASPLSCIALCCCYHGVLACTPLEETFQHKQVCRTTNSEDGFPALSTSTVTLHVYFLLSSSFFSPLLLIIIAQSLMRNEPKPGRGPRERPGNVSGPKADFKIQTCWIAVQFLARKPVNFASLTDSFILLFSKLLKPWSSM